VEKPNIIRSILREKEEREKSPEGQEQLRKEKEYEEFQASWTKKVKEEHGYERRKRGAFITLLPESMSGMNPDLEWLNDKEMFDDALFEALNWDETTMHSHMAMKFILYRTIMPKHKWNEPFNRREFYEYAEKFFNEYYNNH
jgi:hypothetical protein